MSEVFGARFVPGQRYDSVIAADGIELRDPAGQAAARLQTSPGGEVITADGRWRVGVERQGLSWVIVFRDPRTEEPLACAYPRGLFSTYDLWIAPDDTLRLRGSPLTSNWTLSRDGAKLVRFKGARTVTVLDAIVPDPRLGLAIVLGYEAIRYDGTIPGSETGHGGG